MKQVLIAAAVAMTFAPAWAADQTYNVDVVVVGAGAGGTVAAVSAVEGGLKTLMLEKNAFAGGAGNFMEGSFAAESFMQKEKGVKLTKIQAFNEMAAYHHWRINAPLVKAFVDLSGDTIQWVYDHGVHWKEVKTAWRDKADLTWHIYPSAGSLPKAMVETFKAKGGTLLLSTPAEKLIYKDGKVEGVVAKNAKGDTITVNAKNVILATGGYNFNVDMVKKLTGKEIQINIFEVKRPEVDAVIVGQNIARQLEGRVSFRRAVKTAVASTMRMGAEGIKIQVAGRVGGAEMARTETIKEGRIPLHTFRADIDYCLTEALTKVGILGVKVWICQGIVYGQRDLFEIAGASAQAPSGDRGERGDRRGGRGDRGDRRGGDRRGGRRGGDRRNNNQ